MRLATADQMREIEKIAQSAFKISNEILMETAGSTSAKEIEQSFRPELVRGKVAIICGTGNNGGDGFVVARHLFSSGMYPVEIFVCGEKKNCTPLSLKQWDRAKEMGIKITILRTIDQLKGFSLYVDALFGVGIKREVVGLPREVILFLNSSSMPVACLDVPSGLCPDTGKVFGVVVRATLTITYGLAKPGFYTGSGPENVGKIYVLQIGLPRQVFKKVATTHFLFNARLARRWLPVRGLKTNKSNYGHLLVVAGSPGMWGAAALTLEAAFRVGSGYVTLATETKELAEKYLVNEVGPEILLDSLENENILLKKTAVVVGPGAGTGKKIENFILKLLKTKVESVLLDADAISIVSQMKNQKLLPTWVMTPHSGELGRMLNVTAKEIDDDRFHYSSLAAKKFGCFILLKGFRSILASPSGHFVIINSGNPALAKAGSGDVLAGIIGGFLAQGLPFASGVATGAYIHGRIADEWIRTGNDVSTLMPRDILAALPAFLGRLKGE